MAPSTRRPRRNKYGNEPAVVDGFRFASKAEARRYGELKLLTAAGKVTGLVVQPRFRLHTGVTEIGTYVGDFDYYELTSAGWRRVCEDVKGVQTATFRLKWKLVKALYPDCDFRLITKKRASSGRVGERAA